MVKVNRINTSQLEGDYSNDSDKRPKGEMALYDDNNGSFDLVIHDGVNSTDLNKVLGKGKLYGHGADSSDGNQFDTIKLIPDIPAYNSGSDQYVVIDPTAPNHVHIRAGGSIDNSDAELIVGGENSYLKIGSGVNPSVYVASNENEWTFNPSGEFVAPNGATIGSFAMGFPTFYNSNTNSPVFVANQDIDSGGPVAYIAVGGNSEFGGEVGIAVATTGLANLKSWSFTQDGSLNFPNATKVMVGSFDNGTSGNSGISLYCYAGYELNWQGGHLKSTQDNGVSADNILADSAIEFPGSGIDNVEINSSGIVFSDSTVQHTAYNPKLFGSFYDTTTQSNISNTGVNTVSYNTSAISSGVSITSGNRITFSKSGYYNIQFSLQYEKTDSGDDTVDLWLSRTGVYEPWSNTSVSVLGNNGKAVASWNFIVPADSGDYYQLHWYSADTSMKVLAQTGLISPTRPDIPSVILTVIEI